MNSKRKLWTNIGSLALVAVIAVGAIVGVLAALNTRVSSSFSISYTALNVHAIVTGSYYQSSTKATTQIAGSPIEFLGSESGEPEKSFSKVENLTIPTATDYINMFYTIKNTSDIPFGATLNFVATTSTNMKITYCTQYWDGEAESLPQPDSLQYTNSSLPAMYLYGNQSNKEKSAVVIGVHVEVDNVVQNAGLDAHVDFNLSSQVEEPPQPIQISMTGTALGGKIMNFAGSIFQGGNDGTRYYATDNLYDVIFDYYTADGIYNINGKNVIENPAETKTLQEGIEMYKVTREEDPNTCNVYILSKSQIVAPEDLSWFSTHYGGDDSCTAFGMYTRLIFNNFDTSNVTNMFSAFFCSSSWENGESGQSGGYNGLCEIDLRYFDTHKVTKYDQLFIVHGSCKIIVGSNWTIPDSAFRGLQVVRV